MMLMMILSGPSVVSRLRLSIACLAHRQRWHLLKSAKSAIHNYFQTKIRWAESGRAATLWWKSSISAGELYFRGYEGRNGSANKFIQNDVKSSMTCASGSRALQTGNISCTVPWFGASDLTGHSVPKYQHADRNRTSLNRFAQVKRQTWNSGQGVSRGDIEQGRQYMGRFERAPTIKTSAQLIIKSSLHQHI